MAQLPRKFQRIFAETAGTDEVGVVGSRASGTPTTSKDLDVIQSNNRFVQGWFLTTVRQTLTGGVQADLPASEDFNGLLFLLTSQLQYLFQNGIPEWLDDANQRYYENISFVQVNGDVYQAIQGDDGANINAQQNPTTSPDWWRLIWSRTSTAFYRAIVGAETINLTAGTPPKFIEVTGGTPFTLTLNGFVSPPGSDLTIFNNTASALTLAGSSGLTGTVEAGGVRVARSNDSTMLDVINRRTSSELFAMNQNVRTTDSVTFDTITANTVNLQNPVYSSLSVPGSGNVLVPAGTYTAAVGSNNIGIQVFDGASWQGGAAVFGGGSIISDGVNVRFVNNIASPLSVDLLRF